MLPRTHRLSSRDITRLLSRSQTLKVAVYPFVYFVGTQYRPWVTKRWIQLPTKLSKSSVKRHILKRIFYDCIENEKIMDMKSNNILAVPQKNRYEEVIQLLATQPKNVIVTTFTKQCSNSLSSFVKKLWSSAESSVPWLPSNNIKSVLKEKKKSK